MYTFIENYMVIGDLNYDILPPDKSQVLDDLCDIFYLRNIVKNPTCFMKGRYHMMTITDSSIKIKCLKTKIVFISKYNIY
jgi:hypothetical protein